MVAPTAVDLLRSMRTTLGGDSLLLIGMDLIKDVAVLEAAYDDAQGVTAAFNLNLARRINRELGGTIPLDKLRHVARWNDCWARIEMHLEATEAIEFEVSGQPFSLRRGRDDPHREQPQVRPPQPVHAAARRRLDSARTLARWRGALLADPRRGDQAAQRAMNGPSSSWPRLDYAADKGTIETLHLLLQLIGKLPLRLHPWLNHGWHAALRMTPRGAVTRSLPAGDRHFTVELDFREGAIRVECDNGSQSALPVAGKTIAQVHHDLANLLIDLGLPAPLRGAPNEIADPIPFSKDDRPRAWDPDAALRLHGAFLCADRGFTAFRSLYRGKSSPSHLFWGSLDLAVTRFSGRERAAPSGRRSRACPTR